MFRQVGKQLYNERGMSTSLYEDGVKSLDLLLKVVHYIFASHTTNNDTCIGSSMCPSEIYFGRNNDICIPHAQKSCARRTKRIAT